MIENLQDELVASLEVKQSLLALKDDIILKITQKLEEKTKIEEKIKCGKCKANKANEIRVPCGHFTCNTCSISNLCPLCGLQTKAIIPKVKQS